MFKKVVLVPVSGGKDSALCLALALERYKNTGIPVLASFYDTGWEHPLTYEYLERLEGFFQVKIHRVRGVKGGLPALIRKKQIFPSLRRRYCTQVLKVRPQAKFCKQYYFHFPFKTVEVWMGIRKGESVRRKNTQDYFLTAGEKDPFGETYPFHIHFHFPIKDLSTRQVFEELRKRGIPVNPLYSQGFKRVGCFPCFLSRREIIEVIVKAYEGDEFARKRLREMEELNRSVRGRLHIDYTLDELKEIALSKSRMLKLPLVR